jgi:hypothetical protein
VGSKKESTDGQGPYQKRIPAWVSDVCRLVNRSRYDRHYRVAAESYRKRWRAELGSDQSFGIDRSDCGILGQRHSPVRPRFPTPFTTSFERFMMNAATLQVIATVLGDAEKFIAGQPVVVTIPTESTIVNLAGISVHVTSAATTVTFQKA